MGICNCIKLEVFSCLEEVIKRLFYLRGEEIIGEISGRLCSLNDAQMVQRGPRCAEKMSFGNQSEVVSC